MKIEHMRGKRVRAAVVVLCLAIMTLGQMGCGPKSETVTGRQSTSISYDRQLTGEVGSAAEALAAIEEEGARQRLTYDNPTVEELETRMQEQYGICQVNLGEMEEAMAKQVEAAFAYMYDRYPILQGQLTNLTLGNIASDAIAVTEYTEYEAPEDELYPIVMKHQIVLNARDFLNEERMNNQIRLLTSQDYWMEGTTITALVVHELGHVLLDTIRMQQCGLDTFYYINEENAEAYGAYNTDVLAANQTTARGIVERAWETDTKHADMKDAMLSISGYAGRVQSDGGYSYDETCAEAVTDCYLRGEKCSYFSLAVVEEMEQFLD